jgi:hypothetical protein
MAAAVRRRKGPIEAGLGKSLRAAGVTVSKSPELAALVAMAQVLARRLDEDVVSASLVREYRTVLEQLGVGVGGEPVSSGGGVVDPLAARSVAALDDLRARRRRTG